MAIKQRFELILEAADLSQTEFAAKASYSRAALSNFINDKTKLPKADFFQATKKAFPTLNLNWLITGQGDIWDGPAPEGLEDLGTPAPTSLPGEDQALLNRLLRLKLEEVALKEKDPELYRELRLEEVLGKG